VLPLPGWMAHAASWASALRRATAGCINRGRVSTAGSLQFHRGQPQQCCNAVIVTRCLLYANH
jgi:hypothetical protein